MINGYRPFTGRTWTAEEDAALRVWAIEGKTAGEIAAGLNRTEGSVRSRLHKYHPDVAGSERNANLIENGQHARRGVIRCEIYETCIGKTEDEVVAAFADRFQANTVRDYLAEICRKWDRFAPPVRVGKDGRYERTIDRDLNCSKLPVAGPGVMRGVMRTRKTRIAPEWAA